MTTRKFHLLPGKIINLHGLGTAYTESNLTDEAAVQILRISRAHIKFFSAFPQDWEKLAGQAPASKKKEAPVEVVNVGKAAKVAATEERAAATVAEVVEEKTEEIDYEAMSKKELQGFASSKELPEKDWEKLSKTALITYLESKVK